MSFSEKRFYAKIPSEQEKLEYQKAQIRRHKIKSQKRRRISFYEEIAKRISRHIPADMDKEMLMVCMGTRNNWERDCFQSLMQNTRVKSVDISPQSNADYVFDFNHVPQDWFEKWNILYSNSIDHAIHPESVLTQWINSVKPQGMLIIGFDVSNTIPSESDCSTFTSNGIDEYLKNRRDVEILEKFMLSGYYHCVIKKFDMD